MCLKWKSVGVNLLATARTSASDVSRAMGLAASSPCGIPTRWRARSAFFAAGAAGAAALETLYVDFRDQQGLAEDCKMRDGTDLSAGSQPALIRSQPSMHVSRRRHARRVVASFAAQPDVGTNANRRNKLADGRSNLTDFQAVQRIRRILRTQCNLRNNLETETRRVCSAVFSANSMRHWKMRLHQGFDRLIEITHKLHAISKLYRKVERQHHAQGRKISYRHTRNFGLRHKKQSVPDISIN